MVTSPTSVAVASPQTAVALGTLWIENGSEHAVSEWPLRCGLPLKRGTLRTHDRLVLVGEDGRRVAVDQRLTSAWPDGSVRWTLLDAVIPQVQPGRSCWTLQRGSVVENAVQPTASMILCSDRQDRENLKLLRGDAELGRISVGVVNQQGQRQNLRWKEVSTPGEATEVRRRREFQGIYRRNRWIDVRLRVDEYLVGNLLRMEIRVRNRQRARHAEGLWDLGDCGSWLFRSLQLEISHGRETPVDVQWKAEVDSGRCHQGEFRLWQESSGHQNWNSRNHVDAAGNSTVRFSGYEAFCNDQTWKGRQASPTVLMQAQDESLAVSLAEFWQCFPSSMEATGQNLRLGLFPDQVERCHELQGGEQKTFVVWMKSGGGVGSLDWVHQSLDCSPTGDTLMEADVLWDQVHLGSAVWSNLDSYICRGLRGQHSIEHRRVAIDEFGWRNFGDVWADHEQEHYPGEAPVISHYNNQFDLIYGSLLQLARSQEAGWLGLLDPLARHVADIDVYHTQCDRSVYNGGLFWHTDHYVSAGTCTHRSYSRCNRAPGTDYGGGPSCEHNYTTGLLHHYYLTGAAESREAVISLADWVIEMERADSTVLGLVESSPTGFSSCTKESDFHGPGRGAGNSLNALLDGWVLTCESRYLEMAERLIRRVIHPEDDPQRWELMDAERRWSYTVFGTALARYLWVKDQFDCRDEARAYAVQSLIMLTRWMAQNERPYLERPEELEYPTVTWAAQELRKANVVRLGALHDSDAEWSRRQMQRGEELADAAWEDILGSSQLHVSRVLSIVLTEGTRDAWLRSCQCGCLATTAPTMRIAEREPFVSQRDRVVRNLKSPRGVFRYALAACRVTRWLRFAGNVVRQCGLMRSSRS